MLVPRDDQGRPRFSISQFRTYGGINGNREKFEEPRGCPLKYRLRYQDRTLPPREQPVELLFGSLVHDVLHTMERDSIGPEEALERCWTGALTFEFYDLARQLLAQYMLRDSPLSMYATLGFERRLSATLYVDEEFGPVRFDAILDWLGMDTVNTGILHASDYKSDQRPPARATVSSDPQLMGQQWVLEQEESWRELGFSRKPQVIMHLDALRWRDFEVPFSAGDIERWHRWAVAMAQRILRDQVGEPRLNKGCTNCHAQSQCPLWKQLPGQAETVAMRQAGDTLEELEVRREDLGLVKTLVEAEYLAVMGKLNGLTMARGEVIVGDQVWTDDGTQWETVIDWPRLQEVMGSRFWGTVGVTKAAIERATEDNPAMREAALACLSKVAVGRTIRRKKVRNDASSDTGSAGAVGASTTTPAGIA